MKNEIPNWKVQTSDWNVEDSSRWRTEDTDNFFYEIEEKNMIKKIWKIICWPWTRFIRWLSKGLPKIMAERLLSKKR